jgi:hypothetical protein
MDKDCIVGAAKTVVGNIKQAVGKAVGDQKTVATARQRPPKERFRMPSATSKIQSGASPRKGDRAEHSPANAAASRD